jgi:uncharacterized protein YkwD
LASSTEFVTVPPDLLMTENRRILSVFAVLLVCCAAGAPAATADLNSMPASRAPTGAAIGPNSAELAILRAVNGVRARNGRRPLGLGPALHRAARFHSVDMARRGYFEHGSFVQRLRRFGVRARAIGENIAYATEPGFSASVVLQMWMTSPSHRAVLLDPSFRRIGVGVAGGSARLVTADFAG